MKQYLHLPSSVLSSFELDSDFVKTYKKENLVLDGDFESEPGALSPAAYYAVHKDLNELAAFDQALKRNSHLIRSESAGFSENSALDFISVRLGCGYESYDEKLNLLTTFLELQKYWGFPTYLEVARGSITQDLPTLHRLLQHHPEAKLIMDVADIQMAHELVPIGTSQYKVLMKAISANVKALRCNLSTTEHNIFIADDFLLPFLPRGLFQLHLRMAKSAILKEWKKLAEVSELAFVIVEAHTLDEIAHAHSPLKSMGFSALVELQLSQTLGMLKKCGFSFDGH